MARTPRILALAALAVLAPGCGGGSHGPQPALAAGIPVTLQVLGPTGSRLPAGLAGFSYEKSKLSQSLFNAGDTALVALFRRLGPGLLRVGGNSVDKTVWDPAGPGLSSGRTAPADLERLAGFLRAADWQVLYGLNFATNTAGAMAAEAAYASGALGDRLYGFELGNEVDLYHSNGLRPSTYNYAAFLAEWRAYAAAVRAVVPGCVLTGPASAYNTKGYTAPFGADEAGAITLLTQHYYRANGQLASSTIDLLLDPDPNLPATLRALKAAAAALPAGYRLAEANSFYNGGAPNISDSYGTALWAADFLLLNAANGSAGVNFHGGGSGPGYTPIADNGTTVVQVRPEFYGMALVAMAGPGSLLDTTLAADGVALTAYALAADDGSRVLLLVNRDRAQAAAVSADLGATAVSATLTLLTGPALESTSGTLLGGAGFGADGSWSPAPAQDLAVSGSTLSFTLPAASAALVRIH